MSRDDVWEPAQYARFAAERSEPFYDLAGLVEREPRMRIVDLGCGAGALTAWLHRELEAATTVGVDASPAMLAEAAPLAGRGLRFEAGDILDWRPAEAADLVFSNAALQWVEGHDSLWPRLASMLARGGQLAVQMPVNEQHPSHTLARTLAGEEPFRSALGGERRDSPVLSPERYATLLHELGFERQHVRVQIYPHLLPSAASVVEWVQGTLLTWYRERLDTALYEAFVEEYRRRLVAALGNAEPYLYPFRRLLIWGRLPLP